MCVLDDKVGAVHEAMPGGDVEYSGIVADADRDCRTAESLANSVDETVFAEIPQPHLWLDRTAQWTGPPRRRTLRLSFHLRLDQGMPEHIAYVLGEDELHFLANFLVDVLEVPFVQRRKNDGADFRAMRRKNLFLDSSDRQNFSAEGN